MKFYLYKYRNITKCFHNKHNDTKFRKDGYFIFLCYVIDINLKSAIKQIKKECIEAGEDFKYGTIKRFKLRPNVICTILDRADTIIKNGKKN